MKERGLDTIQKIAEKIKNQMEEFRPKVPLLVALRNKGMTTRHWEEISAKVGFTVKPTVEDFNF
jgi:dynein heavy chain, axonemal